MPLHDPSADAPPTSWRQIICVAISLYVLTSAIVVMGVSFGLDAIPLRHNVNQRPGSVAAAMANWDGRSYARIVTSGYSYSPDRRSTVAFFPIYPLAAAGVRLVLGCSAGTSLLIVSHASLVGVFLVLGCYLAARPRAGSRLYECTLLAFGMWPLSLFLRMAYSESLFVLLVLTGMLAMHKAWPLFGTALLVGLVTATRPTGIAMVPVFLWHIWQRTEGTFPRITRVLLLLPVACWGIASYSAYQWMAFGDPLAFVKTQRFWIDESVDASWSSQLRAAVFLEPVVAKYDPRSLSFWAIRDGHLGPMFKLDFWNPVIPLLSLGLVALGAWRHWIHGKEVLLAVLLIVVPYLAHSGAFMMAQGRYCLVAFPVFIVLGEILQRLPDGLRASLLAISGFLLGVYSALFATLHQVI